LESDQSAFIRARLVSELHRLGYRPRIESSFVCSSYGSCGEVNNVVARTDGREPGAAVMVSAHYDSVPAGPGASDDGASVASILEIARALKTSVPMRHPIVLLIDDGEEAGLLGAEAFVARDPLAKDVRAVVNLEARGTSGPSVMFETGSANQWLMGLYCAAVAHPETSSIFYSIYKLLPNNTDFRVFKNAGYQGFNFAFVGDVMRYHTPRDTFDVTSANSMQQQGDNALATLRALASSSLQSNDESDAVFFDFLNWKMIWWPAQWTIGFAAIALALLFCETLMLVHRRWMRVSHFLVGVGAWLLMLFLGGLFATILCSLLGAAGVFPRKWVAYPIPLIVAFWALGFVAVAVAGVTFYRKAGLWGFWSGSWVGWGCVALILALLRPSFSYVFVLPAAAAAVVGLAIVFMPMASDYSTTLVVVVPGVLATMITAEIIWFLYDALGKTGLLGITALVTLLVSPLAPLFGSPRSRFRWILVSSAIAAVLVGAGLSLVFPAFSAESPGTLNLEYYQDANTAQSYWIADPSSQWMPQTLLNAARFRTTDASIDPWNIAGSFIAKAPLLDLPPPALTIQQVSSSQGKRSYIAGLRSQRGAPLVGVAFPPDSQVELISVQGYMFPPWQQERLRQYSTDGWRSYSCWTTALEGVQIQFTAPSTKPLSLFLLDESYGLPPEGKFLQDARPSTVVPIRNGDMTIVSRRVVFQPE